MAEEIDLRSDTVTKPTGAMRRAMAEAEVGDAVADIDPTVDRLERMTAEMLGKEAALFMPSGTMTNQAAVRLHCDRGSEFICEADCHIYCYEQGAYAQLSGLVAHTVAGQGGVLTRDQLQPLIHAEDEHVVRTQLLCLENTHNRWGGRIQPHEEVEDVCRWADENGLKKHLDGARIWNAAVKSGRSEQELAAPFDSISVCYSKGLGAPIGSALVGSDEFIKEAIRVRKLFGGGMRQVGIIAAGAIHALQHHRTLLEQDHANAERLGEAISSCESFSIRDDRIDTNIVVCEVDPAWGTADQMVAMLEQRGVRSFAIRAQAVRFVTHLDVSAAQIDSACEIIRSLAGIPERV